MADPKIVAFVVIAAEKAVQLQGEVKGEIWAGWQTFGGLCSVGDTLLRAMVECKPMGGVRTTQVNLQPVGSHGRVFIC